MRSKNCTQLNAFIHTCAYTHTYVQAEQELYTNEVDQGKVGASIHKLQNKQAAIREIHSDLQGEV